MIKTYGFSEIRVFPFEEMIFEVLLIVPLYAGIFALIFRFHRTIKAMTELNEIFFEGPAEKLSKRDFLMERIKNRESLSNSSKTPWTEKRLRNASEKKNNQLYDDLNSTNNTDIEGGALNNILSKELGVKDFGKMIDEMNENPLLKSNIIKICSNLNTSRHTSMELFGAMMYSKFGLYLAPVSGFCTIFNHLDWQGFEKISRERERERYKKNDALDFFEESAQFEDKKDDCATNK